MVQDPQLLAVYGTLAGVCSTYQLLQAWALPVFSSKALSRLAIRRPCTMPFLVTTEDWAPSLSFRGSYRPEQSALLRVAPDSTACVVTIVTRMMHSALHNN